jgi:hypothetical protein
VFSTPSGVTLLYDNFAVIEVHWTYCLNRTGD